MPVRIYGGFIDGQDSETGLYAMDAIIYRVGDEFKFAEIEATYEDYDKDIWEREAKPVEEWQIIEKPYFH